MNQILRLTPTPAGLVPLGAGQQLKYKHLLKSLTDADKPVDVYIGTLGNDGTLPQIKLLHSRIRQLAIWQGEQFEKTKADVKKEAGLSLTFPSTTKPGTLETYSRSFADCTKEELSYAIQICEELGDRVSCPFRA